MLFVSQGVFYWINFLLKEQMSSLLFIIFRKTMISLNTKFIYIKTPSYVTRLAYNTTKNHNFSILRIHFYKNCILHNTSLHNTTKIFDIKKLFSDPHHLVLSGGRVDDETTCTTLKCDEFWL